MKNKLAKNTRSVGARIQRRCPACNMAVLDDDGEGSYCPNCLYTPSPRITLEAAVAKAEAVAVAESRAMRQEFARENATPHPHRRRAA